MYNTLLQICYKYVTTIELHNKLTIYFEAFAVPQNKLELR
jgi:hypothetical protein